MNIRSTLRNSARFLRRNRNAIRFKLAGRDLHVAFVRSIGMFAQINFCLYMARYVESSGQRLHITLNSENYRDPDHGPNWFDYFFFHKKSERLPTQAPIAIWDNSQLPLTWSGLTLDEANRIFFSQFGIRPEIMQAADDFAQKNDIGEHTLGVHYRGTDKYIEAAGVEISDVLDKVRSAVSSGENYRNIFVASDVAQFVDAAHNKLSEFHVTSLDDFVRSQRNNPVHVGRARAGNYAMGKDALLNALVLSKCGSLIRTTSFLSAWASVFNPSISVSLLNVPYSKALWFPEAVILPFSKRL